MKLNKDLFNDSRFFACGRPSTRNGISHLNVLCCPKAMSRKFNFDDLDNGFDI